MFNNELGYFGDGSDIVAAQIVAECRRRDCRAAQSMRRARESAPQFSDLELFGMFAVVFRDASGEERELWRVHRRADGIKLRTPAISRSRKMGGSLIESGQDNRNRYAMPDCYRELTSAERRKLVEYRAELFARTDSACDDSVTDFRQILLDGDLI